MSSEPITVETKKDGTTVRTFPDTDARDDWIAAHYPGRESGESPGTYRLPDGRRLAVWCQEVTEFPPTPTMVGQKVRIVAPGSGYHGVIGTVTEDYRAPGYDDHHDAILVTYGPGPGQDLMIGPDEVEVLDE